MKQKKILMLLLVGFLSLASFSFSQNISFSVEGDATFGNWCPVPIDVYIDTEGEEISAVDLMMETSLTYKDFVPSTVFPYFLPPVTRSNGLLHIVGFTVDPKERVVGSGKIWTIYFEQKPGFLDGTVRLYFLGEWNTTDTNLSKVGGVDALKRVGDAQVKFSSDMPACEHNAALIVTGWFAGMSYQDSLNSTIQKIYEKYGKISFWMFLQNNIFFVLAFFLLIIVILVLVYRKQLLSYFNKDLVWKKPIS